MRKYCLSFILSYFSILSFSQKISYVHYLPGSTPVGFESEITHFLKQDSVKFPPKGATLFTGSSTIRRWKRLANDFKELTVIQRGFGGSNMKALNYYINDIVLPYKPSTILVYEGDNDLAEGVSPAVFVAECDSFIQTVHKNLPETKIYFISIKPSIERKSLIPEQNEANRLLREHLSLYPNTGFIDTNKLMFDEKGNLRTGLFGPDGLHMNRKGYQLWATYIKQQLGWKD